MGEQEFSCIDCGLVGCAKGTGSRPAFCPGSDVSARAATDKDESSSTEAQDAMAAAYEADPFALEVMRAASQVSADGFDQRWCRVEETLALAHHMGWRRVGIACCAGLMDEARAFAQVLRAQGFQPFGICCKVGALPKGRLGAQTSCCDFGAVSCNPLLQAELLAQANTQVNVIVGLCVGHDLLFNRASRAPVTTLVAKDRATAHNPAGALRAVGTASFYNAMTTPNPAFAGKDAPKGSA